MHVRTSTTMPTQDNLLTSAGGEALLLLLLLLLMLLLLLLLLLELLVGTTSSKRSDAFSSGAEDASAVDHCSLRGGRKGEPQPSDFDIRARSWWQHMQSSRSERETHRGLQ